MASVYGQSISPSIKYLKNLSGIVQKGMEFADAQKMKHEYMLNFRIAHDMQGLTYQVQSCCNTAKFLVTRLAGGENKIFPDNETTFAQLQQRIQATLELLETVDARQMDGREAGPVLMESRMGTFRFESAQAYLAEYAMPNFYFHLGSAYCILRNLGVPLGALDFFGTDTFKRVEG